MKKILALPLFFFFIVLTVPAFAYIPSEINITDPSTLYNKYNMVACSNSSGTFYCYRAGTPSGSYPHTYLERYNATWGDRQYCDTGIAYGNTYTGMALANSTHLIFTSTLPEGARIFNITDEAFTDNDCSGSVVTALNDTFRPGITTGGGYDAEAGVIYWAFGNGIRNATNNNYLSAGFASSIMENLKLPNQSDSSIVWGMYSDLFFKYVSAAFDSSPFQASVTFGYAPTGAGWDLFKENASTTWLYAIVGSRVYKTNFSAAEQIGENYIVAVSPAGNMTISDTTPELHAIVYSAGNGTVAWYVDGNFKANNTVTTDGVSADVYFTTATLGTGNHYWQAYFYPTGGFSFDTGRQYFIVNTAYEGSDYTGADQIDALGDYLDNSFSTPYGGEIFALIVSGLVAGIIWFYSGSRKIEYLIAPMMFILACFAFVGLFPMWFLVLQVMVIAIFIFFKVR